jgi:hypothetical protein
MHVHLLSIAPMAIYDSCDNDKLVLGNEIPDTSFLAFGFVSRMRNEIEFEGGHQGNREEEEEVGK